MCLNNSITEQSHFESLNQHLKSAIVWGGGAHHRAMVVGVKKELGGRAPHHWQGQLRPDLAFAGAGQAHGLVVGGRAGVEDPGGWAGVGDQAAGRGSRGPVAGRGCRGPVVGQRRACRWGRWPGGASGRHWGPGGTRGRRLRRSRRSGQVGSERLWEGASLRSE
jgi:hypothetical protein